MISKKLIAAMLTLFSASSFALSIQGEGQGTAGQPGQVTQPQDQAKGTGGQNVASQPATTKIILDYRNSLKDSSAVTEVPKSKVTKPVIAQ